MAAELEDTTPLIINNRFIHPLSSEPATKIFIILYSLLMVIEVDVSPTKFCMHYLFPHYSHMGAGLDQSV
jgi:hypothetical protein